MSLTYVDRIVAPLVEAACISTFVSNLAPSVPAAVRHPAALALLNVSVHDLYKSRVAEAGGVEAAVALLGSDNPEVKLTYNIKDGQDVRLIDVFEKTLAVGHPSHYSAVLTHFEALVHACT